jgi:Domain of unknown function (DUF397)
MAPVNAYGFLSATLQWRKSSHSVGNGECVEAASAFGWVAVRDSKNPGGPVVFFTARAWCYFILALKNISLGIMPASRITVF